MFCCRPLLLAAALLLGGAASQAAAEGAAARATPLSGQDVAQWDAAQRLIARGDLAPALARLKDLAQRHPSNARLNAELAFLHFRLGQGTSARARLALAKDGRAEMAGAPTLGPALAALEVRLAPPPTWSWSLRAALVPQSNAGRQTSAETLTIGGLDFTLNQRPKAGVALDFGVAGQFRRQGRVWTHGVDLSLSGKLQENRAWNDVTLQVSPHLGRDFGAGTLRFGATAALRLIGDKPYSQDMGPFVALSHPLGADLRADAHVSVYKRRHLTGERREADFARAGLSLTRRLSPATEARFGGFLLRGRSEAVDLITRETGVSLGLAHRFAGGFQVDVAAARSWAESPRAHPLFGNPRREVETSLRLRATHASWDAFGFQPVLGLVSERRKANIPLYGWKNRQIELSWVKRF